MSLRNMMFWRREAPQGITGSGRAELDHPGVLSEPASSTGGHQSAEVIRLPSSPEPPLAWQPPAGSDQSEFNLPKPSQVRSSGLMNARELEEFFGQNHFGFGRYNGSRFRCEEALSAELSSLIARFQNILVELIERRKTRQNRLRSEVLGVRSLSPSMAEKLQLADEQVQREVDLLQEQIQLSEQRRGWVLEALNRYRLGFDRGLREALDYDLLNG